MHRLVVDRVYENDPLPAKLAELDIPFGVLLEQADATDEAARRAPYTPRSRVQIKRILRDRLLRVTFQSFDGVEKALTLAGLSGNWRAIGGQFTPALTRAQIKKRLNEIVQRRNQIVHEGDYARLQRPRDARLNAMTAAEADRDINFVAELIDAIHAVVPSA